MWSWYSTAPYKQSPSSSSLFCWRHAIRPTQPYANSWFLAYLLIVSLSQYLSISIPASRCTASPPLLFLVRHSAQPHPIKVPRSRSPAHPQGPLPHCQAASSTTLILTAPPAQLLPIQPRFPLFPCLTSSTGHRRNHKTIKR
jgi:hypothetical protein